MKLLILLLIAFYFTACAPASPNDTAQATIDYAQLDPSIASCDKLSTIKSSDDLELLGYANDNTLLIHNLKVSWSDGSAITDQDLNFGTYCVLHIQDQTLIGVTMDIKPGCNAGWQICD